MDNKNTLKTAQKAAQKIEPKAEREIELTSRENISSVIGYEIIRSRRKTCSIALNSNGTLTVRAPLYARDSDISALLLQKQHWITSKCAELALRQEERAAEPISHYTQTQRTALEKRYRAAAGEYIPQRVTYYISAYPSLITGTCSRISIRDQKTRWGSCSSRGTLSFNWRLMLAPPGILDYVVVHELCHLTHMNHSPAFWLCVESILPDYRVRRQWLKEHGDQLTLS